MKFLPVILDTKKYQYLEKKKADARRSQEVCQVN